MPDSSLRSRMTGKYLILFRKKLFFVSAHTYPFRRLTPPPSPSSGDGSRSLFCSLCTHLTVNTFIKLDSFFLSRLLPPNTEGSAEPCEAIGASWRTQGKIIFLFLLTVAPSVNLTVDTFPDKRGRLAVYVLFFFTKKHSIPHRNTIHFCRHSWAADRIGMMTKENIIWLLAKNPA